MKNKNVGFLIVGIAAVIVLVILLFNLGMKDLVKQSCGHGASCIMYDTISEQTWISLAVSGLVFVIGFFLIFSKEEKEIVIKKVREKADKNEIDFRKLDDDYEKKLVKILQEENGAEFQRTLMEKLEIGKIKITRLLDKLEAKQVVKRKRRGMTNIVVLISKQNGI